LNNLSGSRTLRLYGSNFNGNSNRGTIIYWEYYNRVLTEKEIADITYGYVEPTDVADLEYYFSHQNGYSYNGVTLTKTGGDFDKLLIPSGSTSGKDVFGNTISNPRASGAYNFDGNSWVAVKDNASIKITDSITYELWYYHVETDDINHLIGKRSSDTNWLRIYSGSANTIRLERNGGQNTGDDSITENAWNHIIATVDGSNVAKIYINGVLIDTISSFSPWGLDNSGDLTLGAWVSSTVPASNSYTTGQIANARVYNYALTADQVADNFNEKASTFGGTKVASELDAYIERTASDGATVVAHSCLVNYLTELDKK